MAAPDTDVSLQIEPSKTPAKLEDLSKESGEFQECILWNVGKTPQEGEQSWEGTPEEQRKDDAKKASTPTEETRPPWKGVLVECAKLWTYLSGVATFERTNMLRKGREVHKIYVEVIKGKTFLDDQFTLTEFGRMVLQNGTIRAGRAKNAKQIVVARETLYCSGSGACKRACGYYGECMPGCDKTKMRGHKCSYRSNSPSSPNQRTPPSGRKPESPCHSPKMTSSPNKNLPNNDALSNGAINTMPMNLPTHNLPNSLAPLINNLPNSVLSSQMGLPLGFQHVLPIASQSAIFPSQGNHGNLASLFAGASSQYFPITQNTDHNSPQDVPLPLVKVKKEPIETEIEKAVAMEINEALNRNGMGISSPPQERAKARKRFTPVQRENRMFSINSLATDSDRNGTRHDLDSHVRKELQELVTRREHERGAMGSTADSVSNYSPINYSINGDKNCDDAYTYVWDGDTRSSEVNDGEGKPKVQHETCCLKISYLGWDYHGFAVQEDTDKTIELALFDALIKTKLIESREISNYHRCGRTDKGVSAFSQVISIDLRTNLLEGPGVKVREDGTANDRPGDKTIEIKYVHILNKVLPQEIRVLAWTPVNTDFSARFDCKKRTYKYFFPKGNLNLQIMSEAADKLVGEHDFRNFCKMDVGNGVVNFMRRIVKADITVLDERDSEYQMCELTITGLAFLWHQIRCIVTVLFLVGQGNEKPQIIDELLDIDKHPRKPQYTMASELR
ncbi:DEG1 [Mytilus edulis]|uniref:PUS3 n=1 Tax=Mytilus edulis TaxID=6550 RepID=A0A8S3RY90_MYTED|nr:DEG1 [Mytilus edulis]